MPEAVAASRGGLVTALAPILARRPVTIHLAPAPDGRVHMSVIPVRTDDKEDVALGRGFAVEDTPEALDAGIPALVSDTFVPSHASLQAAIEQAASANRTAADRALRGAQAGKKTGAAAAARTATPAPAPAPASEAAAAEEPAAPAPAEAPSFFD